MAELRHLESTAGANLDSTLIVHPLVFQDFIDFNDFLGVGEALGMPGVRRLLDS